MPDRTGRANLDAMDGRVDPRRVTATEVEYCRAVYYEAMRAVIESLFGIVPHDVVYER